MTKSITTGIVLLSLAALAVAAEPDASKRGPQAGGAPGGGQQQNADERFKLYDTDKDGKLALAEYVAGGNAQGQRQGAGQRAGQAMGTREDRFKTMDTNKDGFLSLDEYKAGRASMGGGQRGRDGAGKSST
jgi:hypothetical protein